MRPKDSTAWEGVEVSGCARSETDLPRPARVFESLGEVSFDRISSFEPVGVGSTGEVGRLVERLCRESKPPNPSRIELVLGEDSVRRGERLRRFEKKERGPRDCSEPRENSNQ